MRVVTWNCHRAATTSPLWDYLLELEPDIALLQEVSSMPDGIDTDFESRVMRPTSKSGGVQRFQTVVLVKGEIREPIPLSSGDAWVRSELDRFAGNLVGRGIELGGEPLNVVSVYSPAWPIERTRLVDVDSSAVRLAQNPDVWLSDILLASLRAAEQSSVPWIIGGDFNLSETFDQWAGGPRGNLEYLDRMAAFGLTECLRHSTGMLTPTFRNARGGKIVHQMDHLFVSPALADRLVSCCIGDQEQVFNRGLSDHLPIIADFTGYKSAGSNT